jgi:hypothetical protein
MIVVACPLVLSAGDYSDFPIVYFYGKNTHFLSCVHVKQGQKRNQGN